MSENLPENCMHIFVQRTGNQVSIEVLKLKTLKNLDLSRCELCAVDGTDLEIETIVDLILKSSFAHLDITYIFEGDDRMVRVIFVCNVPFRLRLSIPADRTCRNWLTSSLLPALALQQLNLITTR